MCMLACVCVCNINLTSVELQSELSRIITLMSTTSHKQLIVCMLTLTAVGLLSEFYLLGLLLPQMP